MAALDQERVVSSATRENVPMSQMYTAAWHAVARWKPSALHAMLLTASACAASVATSVYVSDA
jgi:hypothetical protein